eukprot:m51a1_g2401 hypothetical protein (424) ;mRNA; r:763453-765159
MSKHSPPRRHGRDPYPTLFSPPQVCFKGTVAAISVELARPNAPVEIAVSVLTLSPSVPLDSSELSVFHAFMRGERVGRAEQYRHGLASPAQAPEAWLLPVDVADRLRRFFEDYPTAVVTSETSRELFSALRNSAFFGRRVPFFIHMLREVATVAAFEGTSGPPGSRRRTPPFEEMLEEEMKFSLRDVCAYHGQRDPMFHCALSRARAVARVVRRCWTGDSHPRLSEGICAPVLRTPALLLPACQGEAEQKVLFAAALRGSEIAVCSFLLHRGEVSMMCQQMPDPSDSRQCAQLFETMRALTGGPNCLIAPSADGERLSKELLECEEAAGDSQARWAPSFFVVEPSDLRWDTHESRRLREDLEEHTRRAAESSSALCCGTHHGCPSQCALAAARAVALGVRAAYASIVPISGRSSEETPLPLRV